MTGKLAEAGADLLPEACTVAQCASWLPREELTRFALLAYEMAWRGMRPNPGESFMQDGYPWSNRATFRDFLLDNLALLVGEHARVVGASDVAIDEHEAHRLGMLRGDFRDALEHDSPDEVRP